MFNENKRHIICILEVSTIHQVSMATLMSYLDYMHYAHNLLIQSLQWHSILSSFFFRMSIFMFKVVQMYSFKKYRCTSYFEFHLFLRTFPC